MLSDKLLSLLQKVTDFEQFCYTIQDLTAKQKGDMFEFITYYAFKLSPILNQKLIDIWMYKDIPQKIKDKLKLPKRDKGIDLLIELSETQGSAYYAIQCKFRQDSNAVVAWNELATFFGLSFGLHDKIRGGFFVTNTYDVCDEVENSTKVTVIDGAFFDDNLPDIFFGNILKCKNNQKIEYVRKEPLKHQRECIDECKKYYNKNETFNDQNESFIDSHEIIDANSNEVDENDDNKSDFAGDVNEVKRSDDMDDCISDELGDNELDLSRGYIEMACGSGKTLTSYWIDKELNNNMTVVFVPSLYLLSQFYIDWITQNCTEDVKIEYLLIGSDVDVDVDTKQKTNGLMLCTDPEKIKEYVRNTMKNNKKLVIISTYQSSNKLTEACKNDISFDFGIFDEAHKTVGQAGKLFSSMITDDNLIIKKRLFMTATPKIYGGKDDNEILSMNNQKYYGKRLYRYNTKNGIDDGRLVDYQVVTMIATNNEIQKLIAQNKLIKYKKMFVDEESNYLGTIILLLKKMHDGTSNHMVTYHNTVARAKKFSEFLALINQLIYKDDELYINTFSGSTSMSQRRKIMKEFIDSKKSIMCTAKVMNEGINIPIIDSVCFVDSRQSTVDIVQCIGRSLRIYKDKKIAHIYVPTFIEDLNDDTVDNNKVFGNTIKILKNMKTTDEGVTEYFTIKVTSGTKTRRKILVFERTAAVKKSEEIELNEWITNVEEKMWKIIDSFMSKYNEVKKWVNENERIPSIVKENNLERSLGEWCGCKRRAKKTNKISKNQIKLLEELPGWYWEYDDVYNSMYAEVKEWIKKNGKLPSNGLKDKVEKRLATWCDSNKYAKKNNELSENKIKMLEQLPGWFWNKYDHIFDKTYTEMEEWIRENKKIPISTSKNDVEKRLGNWCNHRRTDKRNNKLSEDIVQKLEQLPGWYWGSDSKKNVCSFEEVYVEIKCWVEKNGKIPLVESKDPTEKRFGKWCSHRRADKRECKLSENRTKLLEEIDGWYWDQDDLFKKTYDELKQWVEDNQKLPSSSSGNETEKRLGFWCLTRRVEKKKKKLSNDKILLIEQLSGWKWVKDDMFKKTYDELKQWIEINKKIPSSTSNDKIERCYGNWCKSKRKDKRFNKLHEDRIKMLEQLPNWYWEYGKIDSLIQPVDCHL